MIRPCVDVDAKQYIVPALVGKAVRNRLRYIYSERSFYNDQI